MADLIGPRQAAGRAEAGDEPSGSGPSRYDRWVALGVVIALLAIVAVRTVAFGWSALAPDDARYLFVGLSIFAGDGPVTPAGNLFLLRAPVYGVILATGSLLAGGDPVDGARLVAVGIAVLGLLGAVRIGWLLGGAGGALGTGLALLAVPLVWRLLPTLRVDLAQTAGVIAVVLALWRPTPGRWALAGVLFGVTVLVKETVLPLAFLPLVFAGSLPTRRLLGLWGVFLACAVAIAAWWWIVVWVEAGVVFPANAFGVIETREVGAELRFGRVELAIAGIAGVAWGTIVVRARHGLGERLLVGAGVGLLPAALYAMMQGLNARNYVGLAVLSAVAVGSAGAVLVAAVAGRLGGRRSARAAVTAGTVAAVVLIMLLGVAVFVGRSTAGDPVRDPQADELVAWIADHTETGDRVAIPFHDSEVVALRLFGDVGVATLPIGRVAPGDRLEDLVWLGLRDQQLFGYRRSHWEATLDTPPVRYLVVAGPHVFTPDALLATMTGGGMPGVAPIATVADGGQWATIFAVDPTADTTDSRAVPLHMDPDAALRWLDLAAADDGEETAIERLIAVRPVVVGDGVEALLDRLGDRACTTSAPPDGLMIRPTGECPD